MILETSYDKHIEPILIRYYKHNREISHDVTLVNGLLPLPIRMHTAASLEQLRTIPDCANLPGVPWEMGRAGWICLPKLLVDEPYSWIVDDCCMYFN